jgi:hypothetical protein
MGLAMRWGNRSSLKAGSARAVLARALRPVQPKTETVMDSEGVLVRPRKALTLLEKLALRAGGEAAKAVAIPVPAQAPAKRGRGRPRKGAV